MTVTEGFLKGYNDVNRTNSGIGICGLLFVAFVILKVMGILTWSWWWIACPIWIGVGLTCSFLVLFGVVLGLITLFGWLFCRSKKKVNSKEYDFYGHENDVWYV